jgi:3-mercaptopyruvate sulfurtransferase SseA
MDLATLAHASTAGWPADVITYCACPNEESALQAAQVLGGRGVHARALLGGIDGWEQAGYPLESRLEAELDSGLEAGLEVQPG